MRKTRKRYKDMTTEEKTEHNLKIANRLDKASTVLIVINVLILVLVRLDDIVAFLNYLLSYPN